VTRALIALWRAAAGFFTAPAAWALHQQTAYMLVPFSCQGSAMRLPVLTAVAVGIALGGGLTSYGAWRAMPNAAGDGNEPLRVRRFMVGLSLLFTAMFLFAILLQGAAMFILNSCQR
jgi:hypothetical protein